MANEHKKPDPAAQLRAEKAKEQHEKNKETNQVLLYLIVAMAVIYYGDAVNVDNLVYSLTAFFATLLGGVIDSAATWESSVRGSLGTVKLLGFAACAGGAVFLTRQRSKG